MRFHVTPTYKRSLSNIPSLRINPARMDSTGLTLFPSPRSNRFLLGTYPHLPPPPSAAADLTEDDIFAIDISEYNDDHHHRHGVVLHHHHHHQNINKTNFSDSFGILAALPESSSHSHFYHKASMSSSSSSSRTIPSIPKLTQERVAFVKYNQNQSAPVNVPMLTKAMKKNKHFEDEDVREEMVVPPHEMVGQGQSPIVACSVLEGAGRTLKGRDLRQVRNAVWRQTGFMD